MATTYVCHLFFFNEDAAILARSCFRAEDVFCPSHPLNDNRHLHRIRLHFPTQEMREGFLSVLNLEYIGVTLVMEFEIAAGELVFAN